MNTNISLLSWPLSRLAEAIEELARRAHLNPVAGDLPAMPASLNHQNQSELGRWIEWAGDKLGLEVEAVETSISEFGPLLRSAGPALLHLKEGEDSRFYLLLKTKAGLLHLIGPDLHIHRCPVALLRSLLCSPYEALLSKEIDRVLITAGVPEQRRPPVRSVMLRDRLAAQRIATCWLLRLPAGAGFWRQLAQAHLPRRMVLMLGVFALVYLLEITGWRLIGQAALNGRPDPGWFIAWCLLMLSLIPFQLLGKWLDATFAVDIGRIFKKRLLSGAQSMNLDQVKHQGVGQLLSRVMESQALEALALNGGFSVLVAAVELLFAVWILALGAGGYYHVLLLCGWLAVTVGLSWRYYRRLRKWTLMRLDMTHDLIEAMVGHKTRLAQESPSRRLEQEDQMLKDYFNASRVMDGAIVPITGAISRGWLLIGLAGLAPAFVAGAGTQSGLAIGLGGMLLANRALSGFASGLSALARAAIAWTQVASVFHSADKLPSREPFINSAPTEPDSAPLKLIDASDLVFRYRPQGEAILRGAGLTIHQGEKILLEGASGGGKSTLAALLTGLRTPESGLLLINGLDRHTLGEGWHRLATEAPQFHENHILSGSLAFNLLMGRNWPAAEKELELAEAVCADLGLGDLLKRMPSGLMQRVGETGWQLSHGERSRIYLARAILQNAQLTILDESFAALDPETLRKCLDCALNRTQTLLVIAHP